MLTLYYEYDKTYKQIKQELKKRTIKKVPV